MEGARRLERSSPSKALLTKRVSIDQSYYLIQATQFPRDAPVRGIGVSNSIRLLAVFTGSSESIEGLRLVYFQTPTTTPNHPLLHHQTRTFLAFHALQS